ncbi:hypothetical protein WICMUC_002538 [Wickerhamomyces mucosus]|uniref:Major facilitator superfamily (MFS) profile domain-containing protein n=1 Tax=Wickerhamomyces mucosus TaxID=1378264 RepID=A0A9P8PPB8_9ASCO|nr:hypothetical protein WICMUC_002538 [Wickerhamomyces mucosus]
MVGSVREKFTSQYNQELVNLKDYSAWYWRFIPHYRHVEDYQEGLEKKEFIRPEDREVTPENFEFRDESKRNYWKRLFDEYEYRVPDRERKNKSPWRWFDKGTSSKEKALVLKLDLLIVTFAIISYWSKNLDAININQAYVSGLKEAIGMKGNDLSNTIAIFNAGTVIFQVFFIYLFPRFDPGLLLFGVSTLWSIVTILTSKVHNTGQLQACRFFIGALEAGYFMQIHYVLGSWYKSDEIGRRGGLYYTGQMIGALTASLLQARLVELDGRNGLQGWQWMFIIDGLITVPVGILALYMLPGTPEKCTSLFLSDDEIRLARKRLRDANIKAPSKEPPQFFNWALWKKILTSWQVYVLALLDAFFWNSSNNGYNGFALWLKSSNRYSTAEVNRLTSIPPAIGIGTILAVCFSADLFRSRTFAITWAEIFNLSSSLILAIWNVSESAKWYAFYVGYFGITISSVIYGWLNDIMRNDPQERAIVLCFSNMFSNQSTAWIGRLTFPTSEGPRFKKGYIYATVVDVLVIIWVWVTFFFYKRHEKKNARGNGIILYNTKTGDVPPEVQRWLNEDGSIRDVPSDVSSIEYPSDSKSKTEVSLVLKSDSE